MIAGRSLAVLFALAVPMIAHAEKLSENAEPPAPLAPVATTQPDANGVYKVGGAVRPPKVISQSVPEYSREAREKKLQEICVVSAVVDVNGRPTNVHVKHSATDESPEEFRAAWLSLDKKAVEAVKRYRFEPATFEGKPVPVAITIEVNFRIY
jgi:TonB family protein